MQTKTYIWLKVLLLGIAISVTHIACGGFEAGTPHTVNPAALSSPASEPAAPYTLDLISITDNLERLTSYRAGTSVSYAGSRGGQSVDGQIDLLADVDRLQDAYHYAQTVHPQTGSVRAMDLYQLAGTFYLQRGDDTLWFESTPQQAIDPADMGILVELENMILLPETVSTAPVSETWQGQNVQKYVFTHHDLTTPDVDLTVAQGELRVDTASSTVVQYALTATLAAQNILPVNRLLERGQVTVNYEVSHQDRVAISLPAAPLLISSTLMSLPRPPDAALTAIYPTFLEYTTAITPISATLYFGSHLPSLGWTQEITSVFQEKARLAFARDNENVSILIAPTGDAAGNQVTLSLE